jgi:bla regulator protein BlaR1
MFCHRFLERSAGRGERPISVQREATSYVKLLITASCMAVALPFALCQRNTLPKGQMDTAQVLSDQSPTETDWQKAAGGKMAFEVASVRQSQPGTFTPPSFPLSPDDSYRPNGGLFSADFPLVVYIEFAYKLWLTAGERHSMLAHLPKWVSTDSFTIHARRPGNPTKDQMRLMVQSLLADRFQLAVHFETQQVPVLALTLAKPGKTGPRLRPHAEGPSCDAPGAPSPESASTKRPEVFPHECSVYGLSRRPDHTLLAGSRNTTIDLLAASLASLPDGLDRPVVNRTGLTGKYDFTIEWTPDSNVSGANAAEAQPAAQGTTFLEAVKEQLGLRLEPTKAPHDVLVIDHVEKPSEN